MHPVEIANLSLNIVVGRRNLSIIKDVEFSVEEGSVVGFIGPNGAGKTTTIQILLGFIRPSSGTAKIFGEDVAGKSARKRIGFLPENPQSYGFLKGYELLKMAGQLFGLKGRVLRSRVAEVLKVVDMQHSSQKRIATYSRGMMQRIGLAQALINDPDLLILDEPTGGLDPIGRMEMRDIIEELKSQGKTVFFSSHELSEVERICDRVILINSGRIIAQDRTDALLNKGASLEQLFVEMVSNADAAGGEE